MLGRVFDAARLTFAGGSAFTKKRRPASSMTEVIWALALGAKSDAKNATEKIAQEASVVRINQTVFALRFVIRLLPRPIRNRPLGKANRNSQSRFRVQTQQHLVSR